MLNRHDEIRALLQKTSRTFALSIPLLPEPTRSEVTVAYLLFRIVDTLEDAVHWSPVQRIEALAEVQEVIGALDVERAERCAERWLEVPPLQDAGYLELLSAAPLVIEQLSQQAPPARELIVAHALASARGMATFIARCDGSGMLRLHTLQDLHAYCFTVAGIVGEMLTELFLLGRSELQDVASELRSRARAFGEGLQLVNILKDASADAAAGRLFLPRNVPLEDVFALARVDLASAVAYCEALRSSRAPRGLWAFNILNTRLAFAALAMLETKGPGAKLTRLQVNRLYSQVVDAKQSDVAASLELAGQ